MKYVTIILLLLVSLTACKGRNPSLSDKQLAELFTNNTEIQSNEPKNTLPDTSYTIKPSMGVMYKENRAVDALEPLVTIDFTTPNKNKTVKLSDVASSVRFIKLDLVGKFNPLILHNASIHLYKDKIILDILQGIFVFSQDGKLTDTLHLDPEFSAEENKEGGYSFRLSDWGVGNRVAISGNKLFLLTRKMGNGEGIENNFKLTIRDLDNLKNSQSILFPRKDGQKESGFAIINDTTFAIQYRTVLTDAPYMLQSFSVKGDTLCRFSHDEKVVDFKGASYARPEGNQTYYYNNTFTFRHGNADTIFRVVAPNRLLPAYVLKLGKYKQTINEAVRNFKGSGKDKVFIHGMIESNKAIFIEYSQKAIFSKTEKQLITLPEEQQMIENDLKEGLPYFWPNMSVETGEMIMYLSKKGIENIISKSLSNPEKWQAYAESLSENELLLMLVK